jgi:hypothetical protein
LAPVCRASVDVECPLGLTQQCVEALPHAFALVTADRHTDPLATLRHVELHPPPTCETPWSTVARTLTSPRSLDLFVVEDRLHCLDMQECKYIWEHVIEPLASAPFYWEPGVLLAVCAR